MFQKVLGLSTITLAALVMAGATSARPATMPARKGLAPAMKRSFDPHFQIFEAHLNPPGGTDETTGLEYIVIKGTPNTALDDYSIVVVENESGDAKATKGTGWNASDDRGCVDNIFPLVGKSTDANGICVIRDYKGNSSSQSNTTLATIGGERSVSSGSALDVEFSNTSLTANVQWHFVGGVYTATPGTNYTVSYGGNSLENGGGNYFLAKHINPDLFQKIDGVTNRGSELDKDRDGVLDYLQTANSGRPSPITPWESVEDAVYIPVKSTETPAASPTYQRNYVDDAGLNPNTNVQCAVLSDSTPDFFARLNDSTALITDLEADGTGFRPDLNSSLTTLQETYLSNGTKITNPSAFTTNTNSQTVNGTNLPFHIQRGWYDYISLTVSGTTYTH